MLSEEVNLLKLPSDQSARYHRRYLRSKETRLNAKKIPQRLRDGGYISIESSRRVGASIVGSQSSGCGLQTMLSPYSEVERQLTRTLSFAVGGVTSERELDCFVKSISKRLAAAENARP